MNTGFNKNISQILMNKKMWKKISSSIFFHQILMDKMIRKERNQHFSLNSMIKTYGKL